MNCRSSTTPAGDGEDVVGTCEVYVRLHNDNQRETPMHDITGPIGTNRRPARTPASARSSASPCPTTASWRRRACRSIAASACGACRICRWRRGSGSADAARYIQLFGTEGLWGMYVVEVPGAGALNVERHLYEKVVSRGRRPRLDRSLAGRPDQAPRLRMAEGLAVRDSAERVPPHRQCVELAGAAPVRHVGAERDEPDRQSELHLQLPACVHRAVLRRGGFLQAQRRHRARSDARARHAAHQFHSRHRQHRAAAR